LKIDSQTSLRDLAFIVCTALANAGETAVLTGGSAATIYAPEAYESQDLDFIFTHWSTLSNPSAKPLLELGFSQKGSMYRHPDSAFTLEFPSGPLAVGNEHIVTWSTLRHGDMVLHILNPTDCVRDRLAWFLFNNDYNALEQALAVARSQEIDLTIVEHWCVAEGEPAKFELFRSRLGPSQ
jgi:hypothetical protein